MGSSNSLGVYRALFHLGWGRLLDWSLYRKEIILGIYFGVFTATASSSDRLSKYKPMPDRFLQIF